MTINDVRGICASVLTRVDEERLAGCVRVFFAFSGFGYAVCSSCNWSRRCTPYTRDVTYLYIMWERCSRFALPLLASSPQIFLIDLEGGYLASRLGFWSATVVERIARWLKQYQNVCGTATKKRACICGNGDVSARIGYVSFFHLSRSLCCFYL